MFVCVTFIWLKSSVLVYLFRYKPELKSLLILGIGMNYPRMTVRNDNLTVELLPLYIKVHRIGPLDDRLNKL